MDTRHGGAQCSKWEMYFNIFLQAMAFLLSVIALVKRPRRLAVLLLGWITNLTILRFVACLDCIYYGEDCHLGWGRLTARLVARGKEPDTEALGQSLSFQIRVIANTFIYVLIIVWPLPDMRKNWKLLVSYVVTQLAMAVDMPFACGKCGRKEVCLLGRTIVRRRD